MAGYKVLVVEDEDDLRKAIVAAFESVGKYECIEARDGEEALARAREGDINLVLTDLQMPRLSGDRLLEALHAFNPEIPVIMMTGFGSVESAVDLLRKGAYDYITK